MNKASDHNTKRCEVEKLVFLPHSDFERLKANPYQEHEAITAAKDLMFEDEKAYHCNLAAKDCTELGTMFTLNFKAKSTAAASSVQRRLAFLVRS